MQVNLSAAAELAGVSTNTVRAWIRRGLRANRADGGEWQIDVDDLDAWTGKTADGDPERSDGAKLAIDRERARKLAAEAEMAEIELAIKRAEVALVSEVGKALSESIAAARARLLAIPPKLAPLLAAETGIAACRNLLDDEIAAALNELANGYRPPGSDSSGREGVGAATEADGQPMG